MDKSELYLHFSIQKKWIIGKLEEMSIFKYFFLSLTSSAQSTLGFPYKLWLIETEAIIEQFFNLLPIPNFRTFLCSAISLSFDQISAMPSTIENVEELLSDLILQHRH